MDNTSDTLQALALLAERDGWNWAPLLSHAEAWAEQLRKYARHLPTCALMMTFGADPCDCGLAAIWPKD